MPPHLRALKPLTVTVHCGGQLHRLTWRRGRLIVRDHGPHDILLTTLLYIPTRCGEILAATLSDETPLPPVIPRTLRRAIRAHRAAKARHKISWLNSSTAIIPISHAAGVLEARGRNLWFSPAEILVESLVYNTQDPSQACVGIKSNKPYRNVPPIYLRGPRPAVLRLFRQVVRALNQLP